RIRLKRRIIKSNIITVHRYQCLIHLRAMETATMKRHVRNSGRRRTDVGPTRKITEVIRMVTLYRHAGAVGQAARVIRRILVTGGAVVWIAGRYVAVANA